MNMIGLIVAATLLVSGAKAFVDENASGWTKHYEDGMVLLLIIGIVLVVTLLVDPAFFYLLGLLGLKLLKSPRRVLVALWILASAANAVESRGDLAITVIGVILIPLSLAISVVWLWLAGRIWQLLGLRRMGIAWQGMASLFFGSLRGPKQVNKVMDPRGPKGK